MPGPKMGPRPEDFNEELVRQAPTFQKWLGLQPGEELTYACRRFVKGGVDDEERLMRRIMIARRNNLKDHAVLKKVRAAEAARRGVIPGTCTKMEKSGRKKPPEEMNMAQIAMPQANMPPLPQGDVPYLGRDEALMQLSAIPPRSPSPSNPSGTKRRRRAGVLQPSDDEILMEMDVPAVEATPSYRKWLALPEGTSFRYNQTYIKGKVDHDWLLKKNIWRRMRYRRENRVKVEKIMQADEGLGSNWTEWKAGLLHGDDGGGMPGHADMHPAPAPPLAAPMVDPKEEEEALVSRAVADAAASAAAQMDAFEPGIDAEAVAALGVPTDPIVSRALDAAAQLAASAVGDPSTLPHPTNADIEEAVLGEDHGVEEVDVTIQV